LPRKNIEYIINNNKTTLNIEKLFKFEIISYEFFAKIQTSDKKVRISEVLELGKIVPDIVEKIL
jgi:hypothetical protein